MTRQEMEARRLEVEKLYRAGQSQADVARRFGVSRTAASRWMRQMKSPGGMKLRKATGRPRRISLDLLQQLWETQDHWTSSQFARAVLTKFQVRYDVDHCCRILQFLGRSENKGGARQ